MSTNIINYPNYFSRFHYYFSSIFTLTVGIKGAIFTIFSIIKNEETKVQLTNGLCFLCHNLTELWAIKETILDDSYRITQYIDNEKFDEIKVVIDIGGASGDFSIYCADIFKNSIVYLFEPITKLCDLVLKNIILNNIDPNRLVISNTAVFNIEPNELFGKNAPINGSDSGNLAEPSYDEDTQVIMQSNFNDFLEKFDSKIDIVKIDCEGGEYNIVPNIPGNLIKNIKLIVMEWHEFSEGQTHSDLKIFLVRNGFDVIEKKNPAHNEIGYIFAANKNV